MLSNVEDVISWLGLQSLDYWTVSLNNDDNTKVFESIEDETLEGRRARFRETMRLSTGNRFIIRAKRNKNDARGMFKEEFTNNPAPAINPAQNAVSGISELEVEKRINEALSKAARERELKDMQVELDDLKLQVKEYDSVTNRFIQKLEPVIGMIAQSVIGKFIPQAPAISVAGLDRNMNQETNETNKMEEQRIENALIKWANADPEYIALLEKIAEIATTDLGTYNFAKSFLKK